MQDLRLFTWHVWLEVLMWQSISSTTQLIYIEARTKEATKKLKIFCGHESRDNRDMSTWHPGKNDHGLSPLDLALETPMREMLELKGWSVEGEIEKTSSLFLQKNSIMQDVVFFSRQSNFIKSSP